jgi:hypothetical protein
MAVRIYNAVVQEFCEANKCKHHITLAYSPWVNGLVEGTTKILLHALKRLCAPEVGEQEAAAELARSP